MRRNVVLALVVVILAVGVVTRQGSTTTCTSDAVPAATLLFPFVVFDYNNPIDGDTTLLTIINSGADAQIVRVTLWSDTGIPVLGFNVVLSGYDVQRLNVRDILYFGDLPSTGTSGPLVVSGSVREGGPVNALVNPELPQSTSTLASRCRSTWISYPDYPLIPQSLLDQFMLYLQASQTVDRLHNDCVGPSNYLVGDWFEARTTADPTWMYVTADVVWTCGNLLPLGPDGAQYWQDGPVHNPGHSPTGAQRMTDNVLIGDVLWVNPMWRFSESAPAVHVEADRSLGDNVVNSSVLNPSTGLPQSLYHQYASAHGLSDLREPLPTAWGFHYMGYYTTYVDTWIQVWKAPSQSPDLDFDWSITGVPLDEPWVRPTVSHPSSMVALDCLAYTYFAWDEDEGVLSGTSWEPNLLPLVTQQVSIDQLNLPDSEGWIMLAFPRTNTPEADLYQTWVTVKTGAFGDYTATRPATALDNFNCRWGSEVFRGGFERGNPSAWSGASP